MLVPVEVTRRGRVLHRLRTVHEAVVDVDGIDDALEHAKDRLQGAIVAEVGRAARDVVEGRPPRVRLTPAMRRILVGLHLTGRRHARAELAQILAMRTDYAVDPSDPDPRTERAEAILRPQLHLVETKLTQQTASMTIGDIAMAAVRRRFVEHAGARNAASQVVSTAFASGLEDVFLANDDVMLGWQYSAILDGGTCSACSTSDGREFPTLAEAYTVLPGFGPNPLCYGGHRCRCRLVPMG